MGYLPLSDNYPRGNNQGIFFRIILGRCLIYCFVTGTSPLLNQSDSLCLQDKTNHYSWTSINYLCLPGSHKLDNLMQILANYFFYLVYKVGWWKHNWETGVNYVQYVVCVSWKCVNYLNITFLCWSTILSFQYNCTTTLMIGVA